MARRKGAVLDPAVVYALVDQLTDEELRALEAYVQAGIGAGATELEWAVEYLTRATEWLMAWDARRRVQ